MISVGKLAHFVYRGLQVARMRFEREPKRLEAVENRGEFFKTVRFGVACKAPVEVVRGHVACRIFYRVNGFAVLDQQR